MKVKTEVLKGTPLDWAVAKCEEWEGDFIDMPNYSTDWGRGGPIVEREKIGVFSNYKEWFASKDNPEDMDTYEVGTTPLEAAMRSYVASKLGNEVEIPDELCVTKETS